MRQIIALFFFFYALGAQASTAATRFERLSIQDDLGQTVINSIIQDNKGFLWFATEDGLSRYDGYTFKVFRHHPEDPTSVAHNSIKTLYEDSKGILWVGTYGGGLDWFDATTERFIHYKNDPSNSHSLSNDNVLSIMEDHQGTLWVGTWGGGVNQLDRLSNQFSHYRHIDNDPNSLSHDKVFSIFEDSKDRLWFGTGDGLDKYDRVGRRFSHYGHDSAELTTLHHQVNTIDEDGQGVLWLGTEGGLKKLDGQHFAQMTHQNSDLYNDVGTVLEDSSGRWWIGTRSGLHRYEGSADAAHFAHFQHDAADLYSLSDNHITAMAEDDQGTLWVATADGGLSKLVRQKQDFGHFKHEPKDPNSLSYDGVNALFKDNKGSLWVGTDDGLNLYHDKSQKFSHFQYRADDPNGLSHSSVQTILQDSRGMLWIGTYVGGLNQYNPRTGLFKHFQHSAADARSLSSDTVTSLYEDKQGILWVGTYGGLNQYNPVTEDFVRFSHNTSNPNSLSDDTINVIFEDSDATLWLGTDNGLNQFDATKGDFIRINHQRAASGRLNEAHVLSIVEAPKGTLWVGTYGGLNKFDLATQRFVDYDQHDVLSSSAIYGIVADEHQHLWLSSSEGLYWFNPLTGVVRHYDVDDGVQSNEFSAGAYANSADGELFFGGNNGFNRFYPDKIENNIKAVTVVLLDFLLFNQSVPVQGITDSDSDNDLDKRPFTLEKVIDELTRLTLDYQQNQISFEFAALHFANPMKNQYAYRLEGWDKDWIYTDAENRRATYTNIPAGDYTLQIKAKNKHGNWSEAGKSLEITILPLPWQTFRAKMLYASVLVTLLILFVFIYLQRKKMHYKRALNQNLEAKVAKRTAALEQKNREVIDTQQQLVQSEKMAALGTLTAGVAHEMNNPTNFVNASAQNLEFDLQRFRTYLLQLAGSDANEQILDSFAEHFGSLQAHLDTIKNGTERIRVIVQDLKVFTQLDSAVRKFVSVNELLQSTVNLVKTKYLEVAVFTTHFDDDPHLLCYPAQLNQVFMNLIVNACDAIEEKQAQQGSQVLGKLVIGCQVVDDMIEISIKDNGNGMTKETKNKLFEPFYTTKEVGKGTGLGLSISFGIVQKHGGELLVESELGIGTTFVLRLQHVKPEEVQLETTQSLV
ncbi:MAG: ligand-binding sensor domain-containing protein/signal transduction histidine kinase [Phenylobacterium sp.]|jgi:ligand-binding sensor domain-containing protein/signal transduction histidine kinase